MSQLYSNAVDTTLAAPLTDSATTATLTDGSGLNAPTGGDYEVLVLEALGSIEIVRITARTGNEITITRAQEGTAAQSWPAGARAFSGVTAGTLEELLSNQTTQTNSLALGNGATTANAESLVLGYLAEGNGNEAAAVGRYARGNATEATAMGPRTLVQASRGIALGARSSVYTGANASIAAGELSMTYGVAAIAIGATAQGNADNAIAVGVGATASALAEAGVTIGGYAQTRALDAVAVGYAADATKEGSIALGAYAETGADNVLVWAALPVAPKLTAGASVAAIYNTTAAAVITSGALDLKTAQTYEIPLPTGVTFFPDEVGIIVTAASTVTVQPTVQFGINGGAQDYLDAVATTGLDAVRARQRFQTLKTAKGATTLRFEVTVGATATTLTGRIYWRGIAFEDL